MSKTPSWYQPGDIPATIRESTTANVTTRDVVDVLATHEVEAPRDRIHDLVTSLKGHLPDPPNTEQETLESPRPLEARFIDPRDLAHLPPLQFGTVLGIVLTRYEGTFTIPDPLDDLRVHLFWNRQHTTIALRTLPRPQDTPLEKTDLAPLIEGDTSPASGRSPSEFGIVSTTGLTNDAQSYAEEHDIHTIARPHLTTLLTDAKLPTRLLGDILTHDGSHSSDFDTLLDDIPDLPAQLRERDPLEPPTGEVWSGTDGTTTIKTTVKTPLPVTETPPPPGERGRLYANPDDDGDYGAFDRFKEELDTDTQ